LNLAIIVALLMQTLQTLDMRVFIGSRRHRNMSQ